MNATLPNENTTTARPVTQDYVTPEVNIFETKEGYVLEAEMPGVGKDGLEVTLEDHELTIVGRRNVQPPQGEPLFCCLLYTSDAADE